MFYLYHTTSISVEKVLLSEMAEMVLILWAKNATDAME